jgi:hypothetical protein
VTIPRRALLAMLAAGALVRILVLPLPGTPDVSSLKVWSYGAVQDFSGVYGVGGTPLERREIRWLDQTGTVTYPPMSILELDVAGHIYRAIRPGYPDTRLLNVFIKATGFVAEALFVAFLLTWGRRAMGAARPPAAATRPRQGTPRCPTRAAA